MKQKLEQEEKIIEKIKEIVSKTVEYEISPDRISETTPFMEMYFVDSLSLMHIMINVEKEFNINFKREVEELDDIFHSIKSLADYISKKQK